MAAVTCMPSPKPSASLSTEGNLDLLTVQVINCEITHDIFNVTNVQDLNALAVLTSQPDLLSEEQLSTATESVANYLKISGNKVIISPRFHCISAAC